MMNKAGAPESRDTVPLYEHLNAASMGFKQAITESLKNLHARTTVRTYSIRSRFPTACTVYALQSVLSFFNTLQHLYNVLYVHQPS